MAVPTSYAASVACSIGFRIDGSSFSGLFTRVETGHARIVRPGRASSGRAGPAPRPASGRGRPATACGRGSRRRARRGCAGEPRGRSVRGRSTILRACGRSAGAANATCAICVIRRLMAGPSVLHVTHLPSSYRPNRPSPGCLLSGSL
jgi:hypothetical protein